MKKVDALTKAMEVEAKKMKREAAVKEKEAAAAAAGRLEEKNKPRMVHTKRFLFCNNIISELFVSFHDS